MIKFLPNLQASQQELWISILSYLETATSQGDLASACEAVATPEINPSAVVGGTELLERCASLSKDGTVPSIIFRFRHATNIFYASSDISPVNDTLSDSFAVLAGRNTKYHKEKLCWLLLTTASIKSSNLENQEGLTFATEALSLAKELNNSKLVAHSCLRKANCLSQLGIPTKAQEILNIGIKHASISGSLKIMSDLISLQAQLAVKLSEWETAKHKYTVLDHISPNKPSDLPWKTTLAYELGNKSPASDELYYSANNAANQSNDLRILNLYNIIKSVTSKLRYDVVSDELVNESSKLITEFGRTLNDEKSLLGFCYLNSMYTLSTQLDAKANISLANINKRHRPKINLANHPLDSLIPLTQLRAELAYSKNQISKATKLFRLSIEESSHTQFISDQVWAYYNYGKFLINTGNLELAKTQLSKGLQIIHSKDMTYLKEKTMKLIQKLKLKKSINFTPTKRQSDILKFLAAGDTNQEIAYQLRLSPYTVRNHISKLFDLTKTNNRVSLARKSVSRNWIK